MKQIRILLLSVLLISAIMANAQDSTIVYVYDIKQEIGPEAWRNTQKAFTAANKKNADLVLIHMNTYGGMVNAADSIRTKILNSDIPVWVFIDNNAASAGALISIACDSVYMRPGGNIGAATVVDQSGKPVPDKYQSFMRSMMRSTAESHGKDTTITAAGDTLIKWHRDPAIAEAMVDPRLEVDGVIDSGKVISFTTSEAIKYGFAEAEAENIPEVLDKGNVNNYRIIKQKLSATDKIINFLINPFVHGILIMIIIGGLYFEIQSPGIGFPLAAAALATLLYFAPLYLEGIAENWEVLIFIGGVVLIMVEIFVIPGFGVAGISGIVMVITGLTLAMIDNLEFQMNPNYVDTVMQSLAVVVISSFLAFLGGIWGSKKLFDNSFVPGLALNDVQPTEEGFSNVEASFRSMTGKKGVASTMLRPSGTVEIDEEHFDARAETGFIEAGTKIIVVRTSSSQLYVEPEDMEE
ncbi:MAG TPA: NfeD family protein [Salinivirga sp.]|uniref:NfeD family protein n=1 Tax=Salinivirga sp. TaxID=1970192 RepID=UPI002B48DEF0|nr:NfeD family protein [Salinivirga sp.]HKK60725.1 NfeD family protein [Salinivirga sp.]